MPVMHFVFLKISNQRYYTALLQYKGTLSCTLQLSHQKKKDIKARRHFIMMITIYCKMIKIIIIIIIIEQIRKQNWKKLWYLDGNQPLQWIIDFYTSLQACTQLPFPFPQHTPKPRSHSHCTLIRYLYFVLLKIFLVFFFFTVFW